MQKRVGSVKNERFIFSSLAENLRNGGMPIYIQQGSSMQYFWSEPLFFGLTSHSLTSKLPCTCSSKLKPNRLGLITKRLLELTTTPNIQLLPAAFFLSRQQPRKTPPIHLGQFVHKVRTFAPQNFYRLLKSMWQKRGNQSYTFNATLFAMMQLQ